MSDHLSRRCRRDVVTVKKDGQGFTLLGAAAIGGLWAPVLALTLFVRPAAAQEAVAQPSESTADAATPEAGQGEIVVTAQKRDERAVDVPIALTVVSGEALARGGVVTSLDLTYFTPGLKMDRTGTNTYPAIRGITSLVAGPGFDANVATYIDGVYVSNQGSVYDLSDTENVTVLKGPQGTLFGRNATGGAIQIITRKPTSDLVADASVSYGRFNDASIRGFVSGPLVADTLAFSVAGYHETRDGYLHDVVNDKTVGKLEANLLRVKLQWKPSERVNLTLSGYYAEHDDPTGAYGTALNGSSVANSQPGAITPSKPYQVAANIRAEERSKNRGVSLNGMVRTDAGSLTIIGAYNNYRVDTQFSGYASFAPAGGYQLYVHQPDESYSFETNFVSKRLGDIDFIVGYFYYHDEAAYDPIAIERDLAPLKVSVFGYQSAEAHAGFGEMNYHITDTLTATGGIRYSHERRAIKGTVSPGLVTKPAGPLSDFGDVSFESWTPRFSLRYEFAHNSNIYFTYSQGFKSGGYDVVSILGARGELVPVLPEKLKAYEVGLKSSLSRSLDLALSTFYYDYSNQQVTTFVDQGGAVVGVTRNAAASKIYGADFQGTLKATDELSFRSGISVLHARFADYPAAVVTVPAFGVVNGVLTGIGNTQESRNVKGNRLPRTPDWTVSVGATYEKEFASGMLELKADLYMTDKFYFDQGNLFAQAAYENLDASMSWTMPSDKLKFTLWGRNLTNQAVATGTLISTRTAEYRWSPPRTYGVTVAVKM